MALKPNVLVYLRRDNLIVAGSDIPATKLSLPTELVNNLELQNPEKFVLACQQFFADRRLRHKRVLIVLDQSVVFAKTPKTSDTDDSDVIMDRFVAAMPFEPAQRACVQFMKDNQLHLYATNSDLYLALADALNQSGVSKIVAVTPAAAYRLSDGGQTGAAIEKFLGNKNVRRKTNFLSVTPL